MLTLVPDVLPRRSRLTFPPREQAMRGAAGHACMHAIVVLAPRSVARCWTPFPLATCKRPTFVITCLNLSSGFPVQARRSSQAGYLRESVLPRSIFTHAVIRERLRSGVSLLPKAQRRHIKFPGRAAPRERRIQVLGSIHERPSPKSQPPNRKRRSFALNFRLRKSSKTPPWQPGGADFEIPTPRRHDMMCT